MRKWIPRCSRDWEVFPDISCRRDERSRLLVLAAVSFQQLLSQQKRWFFSLLTTSLHTWCTYCCVASQTNPGQGHFLWCRKASLSWTDPETLGSHPVEMPKAWVDTGMLTEGHISTNPQRIIQPINYISNIIFFPWGVTQWKTIVFLMCPLKL